MSLVLNKIASCIVPDPAMSTTPILLRKPSDVQIQCAGIEYAMAFVMAKIM